MVFAWVKDRVIRQIETDKLSRFIVIFNLIKFRIDRKSYLRWQPNEWYAHSDDQLMDCAVPLQFKALGSEKKAIRIVLQNVAPSTIEMLVAAWSQVSSPLR